MTKKKLAGEQVVDERKKRNVSIRQGNIIMITTRQLRDKI